MGVDRFLVHFKSIDTPYYQETKPSIDLHRHGRLSLGARRPSRRRAQPFADHPRRLRRHHGL